MRIIVVFLFVAGAMLRGKDLKMNEKGKLVGIADEVAFIGCINTKFPYMCSNGQCAESYYDCREKAFQCENLK